MISQRFYHRIFYFFRLSLLEKFLIGRVLLSPFKIYSHSPVACIYRGDIYPCIENTTHFWGNSTHTTLLQKAESKGSTIILPLNSRVSFIISPLQLTLCFPEPSIHRVTYASFCIVPSFHCPALLPNI